MYDTLSATAVERRGFARMFATPSGARGSRRNGQVLKPSRRFDLLVVTTMTHDVRLCPN